MKTFKMIFIADIAMSKDFREYLTSVHDEDNVLSFEGFAIESVILGDQIAALKKDLENSVSETGSDIDDGDLEQLRDLEGFKQELDDAILPAMRAEGIDAILFIDNDMPADYEGVQKA